MRGGRDRRAASADDVLVASCAGSPLEPVGGSPLADDLVAGARFHRIGPLVQIALRDSRPDLAAHFRADRERAMLHHLRAMAVLAEIGTALYDTPWLAFKGPMLSEFAHPAAGLRVYKDLDILVDPGQLRQVAERLFDAGWNVVDSNESLRNPELAGELRIASKAGILLDLHWAMAVSAPLRQAFPISANSLLERRRPVRLGPAQAWSLDPPDALVHVCHHAALAGATRLLHILDADQLARQIPDWQSLARRALEWDASAQVALVLLRAHRWLGTPLPADLLHTLGLSGAFAGLMSAVDRLRPIPALRRDESLARLAARAARPGVVRTVALMTRNGALGVRNRLRPARPQARREPADREAIAAYLGAVEAATRAQPAA